MPDNNESLISHLEDLRKTLIKCLSAVAIVLPFTFLFAPKVLNLLIKFLIKNNPISFNYFSPVEVFLLQIKVALLIDIVICLPYIAKQIWNFILPALYEKERKFIKSVSLSSSFLFILGALFCGYFILPLIINFGLSFQTSNIQAVMGISNIVNLALWLIFAFGVMFQIPLVTHFLIKLNIVDYNVISSKRRYVIIGLLIFAAILTPPDIISQVLLFIPTYALFELGLLFSRR